MDKILQFLKVMEMTRSQPQYGYQLSVRSKGEVSDLAQHHYLVTFIAWQLATAAERNGAKVDVRRVLELSLLHDVGELFGGDINFSYARAFPTARKAAKNMQEETRKFLTDLSGEASKLVGGVFKEGEDKLTDEAIIERVADHGECLLYRWYARIPYKQEHFNNRITIIRKNAEKAKDIKTRRILIDFSKSCAKLLKKDDLEDMIAKRAPAVD